MTPPLIRPSAPVESLTLRRSSPRVDGRCRVDASEKIVAADAHLVELLPQQALNSSGRALFLHLVDWVRLQVREKVSLVVARVLDSQIQIS